MGHSAILKVISQYESLQIPIKCAKHDHDMKNKCKVPSGRRAFNAADVLQQIGHIINPPCDRFRAASYISNLSKALVPKLIPVLQTDAAHGNARKNLFSMHGKDGNRKMVLVGLLLLPVQCTKQ